MPLLEVVVEPPENKKSKYSGNSIEIESPVYYSSSYKRLVKPLTYNEHLFTNPNERL